MGGLVATRSIGQFSTLYGGIEDMLVGMEAVLADGEVITSIFLIWSAGIERSTSERLAADAPVVLPLINIFTF